MILRMIAYDPKCWLRLLFSWKGTVLPRLLPRVAGFGLLAVLAVLIDEYVVTVRFFDAIGHTLMGAMVGFLIVLRTNTAYERFWEGRKLWGGIVNSSRNLLREASAFAGPADDLDDLVVAYVLALKQLLRRETDFSEIRPWVSEEVYARATASENPPLVLSYYLAAWIEHRRAEGRLDAILAVHLDERVRELVDHQGACERIFKTPIPFTYAVHIKQFLVLYLLTLPFVLVGKMGWLAIPMTMVISFGLSGVEEAGVEIEDPFGYDPNDLPLEGICSTIERDATRLADVARPEPPGERLPRAG